MYTIFVPRAHRSQEKALEPLELVASSHEWCGCWKLSLGVLEEK